MSTFNYRLIRRRGFSASISISESKGVVVHAPHWMPKMMIDGFIAEKSDWIKKHLQRFNEKKVTKQYIDGEKHLFFGKEYTLSIVTTGTPGRSRVSLVEEDIIQVEISESQSKENLPQKIKDALLYWYLEKGVEVITEKVNYFAQEMGVNYQKINLKKVSSIWGSCSPSNCLSFNRKLVMAPHEVVDYVVIHEVAHMTHRNHGSRFWALVSRFDPYYKSHRKWLKLNHHLLAI